MLVRYSRLALFLSGLNSASALPRTPNANSACSEKPTTQHLSSPPYENYFYSDCHAANQVVVTSPLPDSNLTYIGPRLLTAWPAGDSGTVAYFAPQNGKNGTLAIKISSNPALSPVYTPASASSLSGNPFNGIKAQVNFNSSSILTVPIMGSIRTIRDFTEGPSLLRPQIQDAIKYSKIGNNGVMLSRLWLDNVTTVRMSFTPASKGAVTNIVKNQLHLTAGTYDFISEFDYPQLTQLTVSEVLNNQSQGLAQSQHGKTTSLSFLSYTDKLLAGDWRFLTYFGRDSMISLLLMQSILSEGQGGAVEAVISSVLERLNHTSGQVCHEETIGDYATYVNELNNVTSTKPGCTYPMVDTSYYLPEVLENYFVKTATGRSRRDAFFKQKATLEFGNKGLSYEYLALQQAKRVMRTARAFAQPGGQTMKNLIHLERDQIVGEWRDSTYGIGGGRIPYDVNTALVPAALRSIASLANAGFYAEHPKWKKLAAEYAQVWEDNTLQFFQTTVRKADAQALVKKFTAEVGDGFPSNADQITSDISFHGLSLDGYSNQSLVKVMNSDDCFRHFLLNTTNQAQLTKFINQTSTNIRLPFPAGLSIDVGMLIANPAYGGDPVYAANWTNNAYQGTVVWGWPMAMMAAGLQRQLGRCSSAVKPDFCTNKPVYDNAVAAYNHLWDLIDANKNVLSEEVWSWTFNGGKFNYANFGSLPPPPGLSPTESDIRQLWSLSFLAVSRDTSLTL